VHRIESEIDKDYACELSYHTLFAYACQLTNRLSHYHYVIKELVHLNHVSSNTSIL